jgi:hypothetical protein
MVDAFNNVAKSLGLLRQKCNNLMSDQNLSTGKSWFDADCLYNKKALKQQLKLCGQNLPDKDDILLYVKMKRYYFDLLKFKKQQHEEVIIREFNECSESKQFWKILKQFTSHKRNQIPIDEWYNFFTPLKS